MATLPVTSVKYGLPRTDRVALLGKPYECPPHLPHPMRERGPLEFRWWPFKLTFRVDVMLMTVGFLGIFGGLSILLSGIVFNNAGGAIGGIFLTLVGLAAFFIGYVWWWNAAARLAVAMARGKRVQAAALWPSCTRPWIAKDVFHAEAVGWGVLFVVLRDGSTEVRASGVVGEFLASEIDPADLGGGLAGDLAGAVASGVVVDYSNSPMAHKQHGGEEEEAPPPPSLPPRAQWMPEQQV